MKRPIWIVWGLLAIATVMARTTLASRAAAPAPRLAQAPADPLARAPGTDMRVVVWNVAGFPGTRPNRQPVFKKVFEALDADLLMLDEVTGSADVVESWLPAPKSVAPSWNVELRGGELVVAVRDRSELTHVFRRPPMLPASGFYDTLNELLFGRDSVAAVGILVTAGSRRLLTVPVHLPCCGDEAGRLRAAPALRDAVQQALTTTLADAVIVAGDFNLVANRGPNLIGQREALDIVQRGITLNGMPLAVLKPMQLDGLSPATWRQGDDSRFPPGRLDWLLYSESALTPLRSFIFEAADLSPEWLRAHDLDAHDSDPARTSDHLPIVADFRWRR